MRGKRGKQYLAFQVLLLGLVATFMAFLCGAAPDCTETRESKSQLTIHEKGCDAFQTKIGNLRSAPQPISKPAASRKPMLLGSAANMRGRQGHRGVQGGRGTRKTPYARQTNVRFVLPLLLYLIFFVACSGSVADKRIDIAQELYAGDRLWRSFWRLATVSWSCKQRGNGRRSGTRPAAKPNESRAATDRDRDRGWRAA
jgi:hypothetical protein